MTFVERYNFFQDKYVFFLLLFNQTRKFVTGDVVNPYRKGAKVVYNEYNLE